MTPRGHVLALQITADRVTGVSADLAPGRVAVRSVLTQPRPRDVDPTDQGAMARWVARVLDDQPKGRVMLVVPRGEVVLKRLNLPASAANDRTLPSIVQLQMSRQLTGSVAGMVVDFVTLPPTDEPNEVGVVAAALPADRLDTLRAYLAGKGRKGIASIGLRPAGVAALVRHTEGLPDGAILTIAPSWDATELVVVQGGRLVFARAADIGLPSDGTPADAYAQRIAVEAKRTWMSYRGGRDSSEVDAVAVVGTGPLAQAVGHAAGHALDLPWHPVSTPPCVQAPDSLTDAQHAAVAPILGVLAEHALGERSFDFASPRRAPDLAAARRQRALLAVLLAIVLGGGLYLVASMRLDDLRSRLDADQRRLREAESEYVRFLCDQARLRHAQAWRAPAADWIAHLASLTRLAPAPPDLLLDEVRGDLAYDVLFEPGRDRRLDTGRWNTPQRITLTVAGTVARWDVADAFRQRLLDSGLFAQVKPQTPDAGNRFAFELVTADPAPPAQPEGAP